MDRKAALTEIKNQIITKIPSSIGKYTRQDGSKVPAIWIGDEPPISYKVEGVEVIIKEAEEDSTPMMGRRCTITRTVEVVVVQHNKTDDLSIIKQQLYHILIPLYWNVELLVQPGTNTTLAQIIAKVKITEVVLM
jgi:hypothetical protein